MNNIVPLLRITAASSKTGQVPVDIAVQHAWIIDMKPSASHGSNTTFQQMTLGASDWITTTNVQSAPWNTLCSCSRTNYLEPQIMGATTTPLTQIKSMMLQWPTYPLHLSWKTAQAPRTNSQSGEWRNPYKSTCDKASSPTMQPFDRMAMLEENCYFPVFVMRWMSSFQWSFKKESTSNQEVIRYT